MRITKKQDQRIRKQVDRIREINKYYKDHQIKREIKLEVKAPRGKPTTSKEQIETILEEYEQTTWITTKQ